MVWCLEPASKESYIIKNAMWQIALRHFISLPVEHPRTLPAWPAPISTAATCLTVKTKSHSSQGPPEKRKLGCLILSLTDEVRLDEGQWVHSALSERQPFEK